MANIGILGGTFDPIHKGHLALGRQAYEQFHLDAVWFMPSNHPPHKRDHAVTAGSLRLEMVQLAICGIPGFVCSDFELHREGNTYTANTLSLLTEKFPQDRFYFIIGADCINDLPTWHKIDELLASCKFIATKRPSYTLGLSTIQQHFKNFNITLLETPELEISSTDIRQRIKKGYSIQYITTEQVQQYIRKEELYL